MEKNLEKKSQKMFQLNCRKKLKNGTYKKSRRLNVQKAPYLEGLLSSIILISLAYQHSESKWMFLLAFICACVKPKFSFSIWL